MSACVEVENNAQDSVIPFVPLLTPCENYVAGLEAGKAIIMNPT